VAGAKKPPGRPPRFTPDVAWRVIALLTAGSTVEATAADVGVTPRSIQAWRSRAWSHDPADRQYVEFERAIQRGRLAAAEVGQRSRLVDESTELQPLDELFADLDADFGR
jgi:transposase-like protein